MSEAVNAGVAIIGAGPAGLTLANLLQRRGVDAVVLDRYTRPEILARSRAGLLENRTVDLLERCGLADRLHAEGAVHYGCEFRDSDDSFFADYSAFCDGKPHWVYPQRELVADLLDAFESDGGRIIYGCRAQSVRSLDREAAVECADGTRVRAGFAAGADGQHGATRASLSSGQATRASLSSGQFVEHRMAHEFQWLTLLAEASPSADHTIYARHERGFAGHLLRSSSVTRFHLQVRVTDTVEDWPDERIWEELRVRLQKPGWTLNEGPIFSKNILEMQSRVCEPMRFGRVFILGDAAHTITPAGGKGMNLAIADAFELDRCLRRWQSTAEESDLDAYSARRLPDIWKAQEFSHSLLHMLHTYDPTSPDAVFRQKLQQARLWQLRNSNAYARNFAESYIGPPLGWPVPADDEAELPATASSITP